VRVSVRYLAAKSEADHYNRELQREQDEIDTVPDVGKQSNRARRRPDEPMHLLLF